LLRVETQRSPIGQADSGSILFFAGSLDYWRLTARNPWAIRGYSKLYWFQGLESEESYLKHGSPMRRRILAWAEATAMRASSVVITPSDAMIDVILQRYRFLGETSFVTIPNLADATSPSQIDSSLWGFDVLPDLVLGYIGGLSRWQCFEETCRIVVEIQRLLNNAWFFVLTQDPSGARSALEKTGVPRYRICSTTTDQAPKYVSSFDLGFMLRRDHVVNRVSCPMKWLEYWQCGVPMITTDVVEIVSRAKGAELNCVVNMDDVTQAAQRIAKWASGVKTRHLAKEALVRNVRRDWTWLAGERIISSVLDALDGRMLQRRNLWKDSQAESVETTG
jgi:hypothetical protein